MRKYLIVFFLGLTVCLSACGQNPRFTIEEAQLRSWEEGKDFVKVTLTDEAGADFTAFTQAHLDQTIDVYYGTRKLMSPKITSKATPPDIYLMGLDDAGKKEIIRFFPPEKDAADRTLQ